MQRPEQSLFWKMLEGSPADWAKFLTGFAVVAVVAWIAVKVMARLRDDDDPAETEHLLLSQVGDLHQEGRLSEDEYRSIKGRLIQRIEEAERKESSDG